MANFKLLLLSELSQKSRNFLRILHFPVAIELAERVIDLSFYLFLHSITFVTEKHKCHFVRHTLQCRTHTCQDGCCILSHLHNQRYTLKTRANSTFKMTKYDHGLDPSCIAGAAEAVLFSSPVGFPKRIQL